jgi:Tol biopolymer transport system component
VSGDGSHSDVAWSILRFASILAVLLVVAGLFALAPPSASADKIVFTSVDRSGGLVVMRPNGKVVSVARGFVHSFYDVSLDGRRLVFNKLVVTPFTARDRLAVRRTRILARANPGIGLRWSPNNRFVAGAREVGGSFQIFVVRIGGGRARRLRTSVSMQFPSWSPDGRRIVAQGPRGLWVINVATGAAREILSFDTDNDRASEPAWSPDGRWIAFNRGPRDSTDDPLDSELWRVRPDGSGLRQLTHLTGAAPVGPPAWSPDGRRLAFTMYTGGDDRPVATIRANGSGLRVLTRRGFNYGVDWSR